MKSVFDKLKGGDLRSTGRVNEVVKSTITQADFNKLIAGLHHGDRKIVMRTADAIEKITLKRSDYLQPHKKALIALSFKAEHIELKWHLALLLSRLRLSEKESVEVWRLLKQWATDRKESKIVRVNSIQSLYNLLQANKYLQPDFDLITDELIKENIPSLNARIRKIRRARQ